MKGTLSIDPSTMSLSYYREFHRYPGNLSAMGEHGDARDTTESLYLFSFRPWVALLHLGDFATYDKILWAELKSNTSTATSAMATLALVHSNH